MGVMESILGHIVDLGYEAADKTVKDKYDESRLKEILTEFITSQKTYFGLDSLDTEIDYRGLFEYIKHSFIDEVSERIYDTDSKKRGKARQNIIDQAIEFSSATTEEAKASIKKLIGSCLDMYRQFYRKQLPRSVSVIAGDVTDSINSHTDAAVSDIKNELKSIKTSVAAIGGTERYLLGQTKIEARDGKLDTISERLSEQLDIASTAHPLKPYYAFVYNNQTRRLESVPTSEEAVRKYPTSYKVTGTINLSKLGLDAKNINILSNPKALGDYMFRHQVPIEMDVKEIRKYLGDVLAPDQPDLSQGNSTMTAEPAEFPEAVPCSIKVDGEVFFDYVLIRIQEILDDGTFVIGNKEQCEQGGFPYHVDINVLPLPEDSSVGVSRFNVTIKNAKNKEYLKYLRFMKAASNGGVVSVHILSADQDFIAGKIGDVKYSGGTEILDGEMNLVERVCRIEDYTHKEIEIPHDIADEDYTALYYLSELLDHKQCSGKWNEWSVRVIITPKVKAAFQSFDNTTNTFAEVIPGTFDIFGEQVTVDIMRTMREARIADYDRTLEKIRIGDDGDVVLLRMIPGNDNTYVDTMDIPEEMKR